MPNARLSNEQITYLLLLLRNSDRPMTTTELAEALLARLK